MIFLFNHKDSVDVPYNGQKKQQTVLELNLRGVTWNAVLRERKHVTGRPSHKEGFRCGDEVKRTTHGFTFGPQFDGRTFFMVLLCLAAIDDDWGIPRCFFSYEELYHAADAARVDRYGLVASRSTPSGTNLPYVCTYSSVCNRDQDKQSIPGDVSDLLRTDQPFDMLYEFVSTDWHSLNTTAQYMLAQKTFKKLLPKKYRETLTPNADL